MKNYTAQEGAKLTLENGGESTTVDLYSQAGFEMLSNLYIKVGAERRVMYEPTWLGRPVIQFPSDIVAIQELIWKLKPDLIIEAGVAHGGSLVLSASILELIGKGRVLGIDIDIREHNRKALDEHPLRHRIDLFEGSSIGDEAIETARKAAQGAETVLVMLDSNHSEEHVLQELELYGPLVTSGSYLVAHDGAQAWVWDIPRGKAEWKDDHPLAAVDRFLATHDGYTIDDHWTRFGITSSPRGWLRKK